MQDTYLGNIFSPLTLNRYLYCLSNPVNYVDPTGHVSLVSKFLKKAVTLIDPKRKHGGTAFTDQTSFANSTGQKTIYNPYWTSYNPDPAARRANADMNEEQWLFERANAAGNFSLAAWHKQKAEEMRKRYEAFYCGDAKSIGVFDAINAAYESLTKREQQHLKLDAAGLIPGLGVVFDGTNAILYLTEGDFANAGLSALALLPVGGDAIGGISLGSKVVKFTNKASGAAKVFRTIDDIKSEAKFVKDSKTIQYDIVGTSGKYDDVVAYFNSLHLYDVETKGDQIIVGNLDSNTKVIARAYSSKGPPTLEIQYNDGRKTEKFRFV